MENVFKTLAENKTGELPAKGRQGAQAYFLFAIVGVAPNFVCREFQCIAFFADPRRRSVTYAYESLTTGIE